MISSIFSFIVNIISAIQAWNWYKNNKERVARWITKGKKFVAYFKKAE